MNRLYLERRAVPSRIMGLAAPVLALAAMILCAIPMLKLAGLAPLSMSNMKRAIEQFAQAEPDIPRIRAGINECRTSDDLREGLAALKEKRTPAFKGR